MLNSKACKTVLSLYQNHTKTIPKPYQKPMFFLVPNRLQKRTRFGIKIEPKTKPKNMYTMYYGQHKSWSRYWCFFVWFWCQTWSVFEDNLASKNQWFLVWFWYGYGLKMICMLHIYKYIYDLCGFDTVIHFLTNNFSRKLNLRLIK